MKTAVVWYVTPCELVEEKDVSEKPVATIFKVENAIPADSYYLFLKIHDVTSHRTFNPNTHHSVRTSDFIYN
jgi:hypothetical protein